MSIFLAGPAPQTAVCPLHTAGCCCCVSRPTLSVHTKHHLRPSSHGGSPVLPPLSYGCSEPDNTDQDLIISHGLWITVVFSGELFILLLPNYTPFQHSYCCSPSVNYGFSTLLYLSMTRRGESNSIRARSVEF